MTNLNFDKRDLCTSGDRSVQRCYCRGSTQLKRTSMIFENTQLTAGNRTNRSLAAAAALAFGLFVSSSLSSGQTMATPDTDGSGSTQSSSIRSVAPMVFETLIVGKEGAVLFAEINAPPMNLLGPELVRDLVSLIERAEADNAIQVLVFKSADRDYFISHVDVTKIQEYRQEAAKLVGEPSIALLFGAARCYVCRQDT